MNSKGQVAWIILAIFAGVIIIGVLFFISAYNNLVTPGSYLICEDTCVPETMQALKEFLETSDGKKFDIDKSREKFFFTFYPDGYLKRRV